MGYEIFSMFIILLYWILVNKRNNLKTYVKKYRI